LPPQGGRKRREKKGQWKCAKKCFGVLKFRRAAEKSLIVFSGKGRANTSARKRLAGREWGDGLLNQKKV